MTDVVKVRLDKQQAVVDAAGPLEIQLHMSRQTWDREVERQFSEGVTGIAGSTVVVVAIAVGIYLQLKLKRMRGVPVTGVVLFFVWAAAVTQTPRWLGQLVSPEYYAVEKFVERMKNGK